MNGHPDRAGIACGFRREKAEAEIVVLNEAIFVANFDELEKMRIVTEAAEPQGNFQHHEQQHRQQQRRQPEQPEPPFRRDG